MTTCLELITAAYRKARVRGRGDVLDAEEIADGLITLQSFYDELVAEGVFGRLTDVIVDDDYTAKENERIFNTTASPVTITLPETIEDGEAEDSLRPPHDLSVVVVVGDDASTNIYTRGVWTALTGLLQSTDAPLADRGADGLACLLAAYIAEENGTAVGAITSARAMTFRSRLTHRSDSARAPLQATYF